MLFLEVLSIINIGCLLGTCWVNVKGFKTLTDIYYQNEESKKKEEVKLELLIKEYERNKNSAPVIAEVLNF